MNSIKPEEAHDYVMGMLNNNRDPEDVELVDGSVKVYFYPNDGKFEVYGDEYSVIEPRVEIIHGFKYVEYVLVKLIGFPLVGSSFSNEELLEQIYINCAIGLLKDAKIKELEEAKAQVAKINDELSGLNRL